MDTAPNPQISSLPQDLNARTADKLLLEVQDFVTETGVSEQALGRKALNDSAVIGRLRSGKTITLNSFDKLRVTMARLRSERAAPAPDQRGAA